MGTVVGEEDRPSVVLEKTFCERQIHPSDGLRLERTIVDVANHRLRNHNDGPLQNVRKGQDVDGLEPGVSGEIRGTFGVEALL